MKQKNSKILLMKLIMAHLYFVPITIRNINIHDSSFLK